MCKTTTTNKTKNQKTERNNQWAGTGAAGNSSDHQERTEFSNEWVSTNKTETEESTNRRNNQK